MVFSLQKRFLLFLLLPVSLILLITGVASFIYARSYLLDEWTSTTKLRMEWTAHQIQMRLNSKRELINLIIKAETNPNASAIQAYLTQQLSEMPGVRSVEIESLPVNAPKSLQEVPCAHVADPDVLLGNTTLSCAKGTTMTDVPQNGIGGGQHHAQMPMHPMMRMPMGPMMRMHKPKLSFDDTGNLLSISEAFGGTEEQPAKQIVVTIAFNSFMKGILDIGQWHYSYACLVKSDGRYLAHTNTSMNRLGKLGETGDPLEKEVLEEMKTNGSGAVFGPGHPPERVIAFYRVPTTDWYLIVVSRGSAILAPIVHFRFNYALAGIISLICIGVLIHLTTRPVAQSVNQISKAAEEVERGDYSLEIPEDRSDEIGVLKRRFNQMIRGLKQRDLIQQTFGRYVDRRIAAELLTKPGALQMGGKHQRVTTLMADLCGFTQMSEKLMPTQIIRILNRHFSKMIAVIEEFKGIIVDFYGDSILVFFNGTNEDVSIRALDAVKCALKMQRELAAVSKQNRDERLPELRMRIGIHTGDVVVGNIGSDTRAKYGIVGSAVNETDRIQSSAEPGTTLISEDTYRIIADLIVVGRKSQEQLRGLEGPRSLYEVRAITRDAEKH